MEIQITNVVNEVSEKLTDEEVQQLQGEADYLKYERNYTPYEIMHHIGFYFGLCVSLFCEEGKITMNCRRLVKN